MWYSIYSGKLFFSCLYSEYKYCIFIFLNKFLSELFHSDWYCVLCWLVLFSEGSDFFKRLFNWWNLSCQILELFHHSLLFRLRFIFFLKKILLQHLFSVSLPNTLFKLRSTAAAKKRKSPPLSKRENPLVTHERSMSTWQVDRVIKSSSDHETAARNLWGGKHMMIQYRTRMIAYLPSRTDVLSPFLIRFHQDDPTVIPEQ